MYFNKLKVTRLYYYYLGTHPKTGKSFLIFTCNIKGMYDKRNHFLKHFMAIISLSVESCMS